jgi:hypothetical protein
VKTSYLKHALVFLILVFDFNRLFAASFDCPGVEIRYLEAIEPQGVFGLLTPEADEGLPREAIQGSLARARRTRELVPAYAETGLERGWKSLCERARDNGHRSLWIACKVDTRDTDPANSATVARDASGERPLLIPELQADCLVSTYSGKNNPRWTDLERARLLAPAESHETVPPCGRHWLRAKHEALRDKEARTRLYSRAFGTLFAKVESDYALRVSLLPGGQGALDRCTPAGSSPLPQGASDLVNPPREDGLRRLSISAP